MFGTEARVHARVPAAPADQQRRQVGRAAVRGPVVGAHAPRVRGQAGRRGPLGAVRHQNAVARAGRAADQRPELRVASGAHRQRAHVRRGGHVLRGGRRRRARGPLQDARGRVQAVHVARTAGAARRAADRREDQGHLGDTQHRGHTQVPRVAEHRGGRGAGRLRRAGRGRDQENHDRQPDQDEPGVLEPAHQSPVRRPVDQPVKSQRGAVRRRRRRFLNHSTPEITARTCTVMVTLSLCFCKSF